MTHFDPHKAEEIMAELTPLGLADWSQKIADTIAAAHTPVELATTLHHLLRNLKETHPLPADLELKIDNLIKHLDQIIEHHHLHH